MAALSTVELARIVRLGNEEIKAFGENLTDADMWAVTDYLRSLSYNSTVPPLPTTAPTTETPVAAGAESPSAEGTPVGTEQAQVTEEVAPVVEGFGKVSGAIENKTGADLPKDMTVTLHGYEHDLANPESGTQEVSTLEGTVGSDGTFMFENIEMPENRIFLAEVSYNGIKFNSEFAIVQAGQMSVELPPLVLYKVTDDTSVLTVDELNLFFSADSETEYQILALYTFRNASESTVSVFMGTQEEIPFLKFLTGAEPLGYEAVQDSAPFISSDKGFAMAPNEKAYGILAFSSVTKAKETSVTQEFVHLAVARISPHVRWRCSGHGRGRDD